MKVSDYKFFCGVLYILRTGISWRDLPEEYGNWHTIYTGALKKEGFSLSRKR